MQKMDTGPALGWFFGGVGWFILWTALAIWAPWSSKVTPTETPKQFFGPIQYDLLYPPAGRPKYDPNHPNPLFKLNQKQITQLSKWGFNDCVATDGTAAQATDLFGSGCFCENAPAVRAVFEGGFAVQPWNTLSTLSLSIAGLVILGFLVFTDPPSQVNFMSVTYVFALCYAGMTIILGPFSMMLHLGLRNWGGWFDSMSLFVWFGFVACYGLFRLIVALTQTPPDQCPAWTYIFFGVGWVVAIALPGYLTAPGNGGDSDTWYLILGGTALAGELALWILNGLTVTTAPATSFVPSGGTAWYSNLPLDTGGRMWFLAGGIAFALALTIWLLSFTRRPLCAPQSIQGHAIFHTLSAFAAAFLYKYYRHEGEATPGW